MNNLKSFIVILSVLALLFYNEQIKSQIYLGAKTGLNISKIKYENENIDELMSNYMLLKSGILAGFFIKIELNKIISVQPEILYTRKGFKYRQPQYSEGKKQMNYIEIPVIAKYNFFSKKDFLINAFIGGYGSYWINGKNYSLNYRTGIETSKTVDFNNPEYEYERVDAGLIGGFSVEYITRYNGYIFDIRYSHARIGSSRMKTDALLNRCFSISFYYLFVID